jgi:hypothetical protein
MNWQPAEVFRRVIRRNVTYILGDVLASVALCVVWALLTWRTAKVLPLIEYRQHAFRRVNPVGFFSFFYDQTNYRGLSTGLLASRAIGDVCGIRIVCHNVGLSIPILVAALMAYLFLRLRGTGLIVSILAMSGFLTSNAVAGAFLWQATIFDRLAAMWVALGLVWAQAMIVLRLGPRPRLVACIGAVFFMALSVLSVATKEVAVLSPVVGAAVLLVSTSRSQRTAISRVVAPGLIWAIAYVATYAWRLQSDPGMRAHVGGGSAATNLRLISRQLVSPIVETSWIWLALLVVALAAVGLIRRRLVDAVLLAAASLAVLSAARTQVPARFYLVVPTLLAVTALASAVSKGPRDNHLRHAGQRSKIHGFLIRSPGVVVGLLLCGMTIANVWIDDTQWERTNLLRANRVVRTSFGPLLAEKLRSGKVCVEESSYVGYQFWEPSENRQFMRFFIPASDDRVADELDRSFTVKPPDGCASAEGTRIYLNVLSPGPGSVATK